MRPDRVLRAAPFQVLWTAGLSLSLGCWASAFQNPQGQGPDPLCPSVAAAQAEHEALSPLRGPAGLSQPWAAVPVPSGSVSLSLLLSAHRDYDGRLKHRQEAEGH